MSRLQGHKVQKGDRMAGVSYALYRVPQLFHTCRLIRVCVYFAVLLFSRKVLVVVLEGQFTSPCPCRCPRTLSP